MDSTKNADMIDETVRLVQLLLADLQLAKVEPMNKLGGKMKDCRLLTIGINCVGENPNPHLLEVIERTERAIRRPSYPASHLVVVEGAMEAIERVLSQAGFASTKETGREYFGEYRENDFGAYSAYGPTSITNLSYTFLGSPEKFKGALNVGEQGLRLICTSMLAEKSMPPQTSSRSPSKSQPKAG